MSAFVFSDGTFFVALGLSPRWHGCAGTAVRVGRTQRKEKKIIIIRNSKFKKRTPLECNFGHRVSDFTVKIV